MNYFATELGLTKATKALLAKGVPHFVYPTPDFDPKPRKRPMHLVEVKRYVKKGYDKPKVLSKVGQEALEEFQLNRIFSVIRNEGMLGN